MSPPSDFDSVDLLQWALPHLQMRWAGFRRVRRQVVKRVAQRMKALELDTPAQYRAYIERHSDEWPILDGMCRITISRFWRDRFVFESLRALVLPVLAEKAQTLGRSRIRAWSIGCASGEEPYSVAMAWRFGEAPNFPDLELEVIGTDVDTALITRAVRARYSPSSLKELPSEWIIRAFDKTDGLLSIRSDLRRNVTLFVQDIRTEHQRGPFDLALCRNLALTYFDQALQTQTLSTIVKQLAVGGALVVGAHESIPRDFIGLQPWDGTRAIYRAVP